MGAASTIKYLLFFFNLLILIGGMLLLALGVLVHVQVTGHGSGGGLIVYTIIFIVIGACVVIISFLGCCGAIKESSCMLSTFGALLSVLFLVQVTGAILMFVFKDDLKLSFRDLLLKSMDEYSKSESTKAFWDDSQRNFKCCGVDKPNDWFTRSINQTSGLKDTLQGSAETAKDRTQGLPESCKCIDASAMCSVGYYSSGCFHKLSDFITKYSIILAAIAIGVALVELIGAIFSFRLASTIRKREHGFY